MIRRFPAICLVAVALASSACSTSWVPNWLRPYHPDVQQGNVITKDMVEQLRPGMTRDQVRFLLGTPMLIDIFHQDRWDYPYYLRRRNGETQIRKLSVIFEEGKLARFDSDEMPAEPLADIMILGSKVKPAAPAPSGNATQQNSTPASP
ncbi:MAG TPA: outer membrane protein assembly factor BamE [Burkholderiaceae bacterium]|nr:outer membrane protein assembly factor BamE [Burkholderiaceae bacterium]